MNPDQWYTLIGVLASLALGLMNAANNATRGKSMGMLERGQYLKSVNEAIELANKRALEAETRTEAAEVKASALEQRMLTLENMFSYRITFDVRLGSNPIIEKVDIYAYPERRALVADYPKEDDRRQV